MKDITKLGLVIYALVLLIIFISITISAIAIVSPTLKEVTTSYKIFEEKNSKTDKTENYKFEIINKQKVSATELIKKAIELNGVDKR